MHVGFANPHRHGQYGSGDGVLNSRHDVTVIGGDGDVEG
jgi:hypothetical protein